MPFRAKAHIHLVTVFFFLATLSFSPSHAHALDCPPGGREATAADIAVMGPIVRGRCIDPSTIAKLKPDETYAAIQYLSTKMCDGKQFGFPPGFNEKSIDPKEWYKIKEGYVYFNYTTQTDGRSGTNPGVLRCFANFFQEAEKKGYQPCINAGLRSPAHQRASCLDTSNSVVCGRQVSCTTDLNWYAVCPHVKGLAFDINDKSCGKASCPRTYQLLDAAREAKLFSKVGAGASDPWHVEASGCATGGLDTPAPFPTAPTSPTPPASTRPAVPTNPFTDAARALFGAGNGCEQLAAQCKGTPVNPQACMNYAQRCQGQAQHQGLLQALQNAFNQLQTGAAPVAPAPTPVVTPTPITPVTPLPPDILIPTPTTTPPATTTHPLSTTTVTELTNTQIRLVPPTPPSDPTAITPTTVTPVQPNSVNPTFAPTPFEPAPISASTAYSLQSLLREARTILENLLAYLTPLTHTKTARTVPTNASATPPQSEIDTALWFDENFIRYMETQPDFTLGN